MATASNKFDIPEIKLNGKDIPIKDMSCRKLEITKQVGHIDIIKMELIGHINEIKPIADSRCIEIVAIDYFSKKKTKFKAIELVEEDIDG